MIHNGQFCAAAEIWHASNRLTNLTYSVEMQSWRVASLSIPACRSKIHSAAALTGAGCFFVACFMLGCGGRSSVGRALGCGPSGRGFEPRRSPHSLFWSIFFASRVQRQCWSIGRTAFRRACLSAPFSKRLKHLGINQIAICATTKIRPDSHESKNLLDT